ncbi:hypothetical protein U0070_006287 [Myodes glareolus]|uniref:Uncharacterized protein n=1 Tax=Myodes glareolus TaxID=447135 RepID=A0AAW0IHL9_MYOGA
MQEDVEKRKEKYSRGNQSTSYLNRRNEQRRTKVCRNFQIKSVEQETLCVTAGAPVQSVNSCHSCACGNSNSWDKADEDDMKLVNIPVTTPENLYLMGMELFEEALRRWEQALTFRSRQAEEEACGSVKLGAGDAIAEESVDDIISTEFIHKLEALLQRAYRLQEEFEATLGGSDPNSLANDTDVVAHTFDAATGMQREVDPSEIETNQVDKDPDVSTKENVDDFGLQDALSSESADLFASAAEVREVMFMFPGEHSCAWGREMRAVPCRKGAIDC